MRYFGATLEHNNTQQHAQHSHSDSSAPQSLPLPVPEAIATTSPALLKRLRLPKTTEEWQAVDELLALTIVPRVLAASTIEEKKTILGCGLYECFYSKFGTTSSCPSRKHLTKGMRDQSGVAELRVLRNQARQQLRSMVKRTNDQQAIKQAAAKFH